MIRTQAGWILLRALLLQILGMDDDLRDVHPLLLCRLGQDNRAVGDLDLIGADDDLGPFLVVKTMGGGEHHLGGNQRAGT